MSYQDRFKHYTVEQKRRDLMVNPFFDSDKVANGSEEDIIEIHREYFESMNKAMLETIGESMYG